MSVNKVILLGRLGKDPELKYTPSSMAVCELVVATSERWKDKSEQWQERTEWSNVKVWGKQGENCNQYLSKGRQVYIEGKLNTESWEKDGKKNYKTVIKADKVDFLSNKESGESKTDNTLELVAKEFNVKSDTTYTTDDIPF